MSNTFVSITESEFDSLLKADKGWTKDISSKYTKEVVYIYRFKTKPIDIKVYSSIVRGVNRGCGEDAIRICAVNTDLDKGIAKATRINRVGKWQKRVQDRVMEIFNYIKNKK